jgi:DNA-directed RNA polymerase subunit RPC12/RpoP
MKKTTICQWCKKEHKAPTVSMKYNCPNCGAVIRFVVVETIEEQAENLFDIWSGGCYGNFENLDGTLKIRWIELAKVVQHRVNMVKQLETKK